ncbi:TonB-dependent receptor [Dinghuibacter silviterrae]|uniref:Carboxypeptidase family protein n=1 Tax=Dinghuibacter silviterrae TaxID=1539049 RepID=A0A4R8DFY7_9BACT|nr:TonB-dependent receptor [Dinghuibacter silviterrae]TDW96395.1 carboxypeptidase family protein [Dinghuibacter silviterrae]
MRTRLALTVLVCCFFALQTNAQAKLRGSVKGAVADTAGKQSMEDATVSLTPEQDSTNIQFVITDKHGAFQFRSLPVGRYRLLITFEGYMHIAKAFTVSATHADYDYGTLYMQRITDKLPDLVIQSPPITIKKDTVEYNADMFATKPNAVAEDQIKKLPGIQVDASGNITAQGEKVQRVLVNGRRFFGDDPKLATRNLPPDIIEKYQVFDDLDDQSKFSGFDDGNRVKTINIITKRDKRKGYFGRAIAGLGTDETYNESANFHRFNNDQQISLLGEGNDINKQNFTVQDILGSSGSRKGSGGGPAAATYQGGSGITTVWAGGANYRDDWGPKMDVAGSYFYNYNHVSTNTQSLTERFFDQNQDTSNTTQRTSPAIARTTNQRANFNLEDRIDSNDALVARPNIAFQTTSPNSSSVSSTVDQNGRPINSSTSNAYGTTSGFNINGSNLTYRHKFGKAHRTLSLDLTGTVNNNQGDGYNNAVNTFYNLDSTQTLRQYYNDTLRSATLSPTLSYTEPVTRNSIFELNYNHTYTKNVATNNTYDYDNAVKGYTSFDSLFSNSYRFLSNSDRFTLNYRVQNPRYNLSVGSGVQFIHFNSLNTTKDIDVAHSFVNLTPTVNFTYSFSSYQRLRFYYMGRTGTPSASQLQPLTTTSDDINYTVGNPNLKPQFTHSIRMLYSSFNPSNQNVLFATLNASTIVNDIQSEITPNNKGGQTTTSVNLNGTYNVAGYFEYGFALKHPKSNLNFITNINYNQSQTLVDSAHDYSKNTGLSEELSWTTNIKKNFDMNLSANSTYNIALNTLRPSQDFDNFSEVVTAEITAYTNSGWLIATDFTYTYTNNRTPGYNASVPLLSPSIAKELFKKKNGELRLSVFDLLNENTSVSKTVSLNQVSDSRTTTLTRYVMLTFTYNLNNFAGSKQRRMPGVFPGRFRDGGFGGGGGFRKGG